VCELHRAHPLSGALAAPRLLLNLEGGLPISYRYDPVARTLWIELAGEISEAELVDVAHKVTTDESIPPGHSELVDLRGVRHTDVTASALRHVAGIFSRTDRRADRRRIAVCAPADLVFGLSRMYEAYREPSGPELRVFRTIEEARGWLTAGGPR
jgi:hypothetical protein